MQKLLCDINCEGRKGENMVEAYVVSAFSKHGKGGNNAGVVFDYTNLTTLQKRWIASRLGYAETVFVSNSAIADYRLQYFTPTSEVSLCGHATIATFVLLKLLNIQESNNYLISSKQKVDYTIETKSGILKISIKNNLIFMQQNSPTFLDILSPSLFTNCINSEFIDKSLPIQIVSTGLKDIILPIDSMQNLTNLQPNFKNIISLSQQKDVVGIHAFVLNKNKDNIATCRNFAPLYGIDEESATGTASCALACYLFKYFSKQPQYVFEQGYSLGQVSQIIVNLTYQDDIIDAVYVGGSGYLVCKKSLSVPNI